jgi:[ribosomal protein S5]-alanine N-acetyltransferase
VNLERVEMPRMVGVRPRPEDGPAVVALWRHPRVIPTLWPTSAGPTEAEAIQINERTIAHWERHGYGPWILRDRTTDEIVGRGGLARTLVAGRDEVEVQWAIVPERWGEGLATELAHTAAEVAFTDLELQTIVAFTLPHNRASRRVMEKAGFRYEQDTEHAGLPHVLYRLSHCYAPERRPL